MNTTAIIRLMCVACILLFPLKAAHAQLQISVPSVEYTPEVGQAGKDVVWVPSGLVLVNKMLDMVKLTPKDILYDLGSGDGRTVVTAAKCGARAYGIEYNPDMVALSRRNAAKEGVAERATFEQGDIFESDFSKATVITLFLLPELNIKLRPTLLNMKSGTRIAANTFDIGDWKPDQVARVQGDCESWCTAYLWIVPAKVDGTWKLANGELTLKQQYQNVTGTLTRDGKSLAISNGKIEGEVIRFFVGSTPYSGRVSGEVMEGSFGAAKAAWRAVRGS
jgi:hypothetical protein